MFWTEKAELLLSFFSSISIWSTPLGDNGSVIVDLDSKSLFWLCCCCCRAYRFIHEARLRYKDDRRFTRLFFKGLGLSDESDITWEEADLLHDLIVVELVVSEGVEDNGGSIWNSFNTLALATSAKRPERKSELYEEIFTGENSSLSLIIVLAKFRFFRNEKRTFLDDAVVASTAIVDPMVVEATIEVVLESRVSWL